jgi:hypothetical protein
MVIAVPIIVIALAVVTLAWGRRINTEVQGRVEVLRPPVRRAA